MITNNDHGFKKICNGVSPCCLQPTAQILRMASTKCIHLLCIHLLLELRSQVCAQRSWTHSSRLWVVWWDDAKTLLLTAISQIAESMAYLKCNHEIQHHERIFCISRNLCPSFCWFLSFWLSFWQCWFCAELPKFEPHPRSCGWSLWEFPQ